MLGVGGQGSPHLPEPGDRTSRCVRPRPPAPPGRMPLSAEPAKVTSAHINLINKTMRQGSHYTLIRDDRTGRSCPELSSIPASSSRPGPGRGWGREGATCFSPRLVGRACPKAQTLPAFPGGLAPGPRASQGLCSPGSGVAGSRALQEARKSLSRWKVGVERGALTRRHPQGRWGLRLHPSSTPGWPDPPGLPGTSLVSPDG